MILNNLHKWYIQRRRTICADTILLVGMVVYLGLALWAINAWMQRDAVCQRLEAEAREKRASFLAEQIAEAQAKREREEWTRKVLAADPVAARIVATQWNDAGKRRAGRRNERR